MDYELGSISSFMCTASQLTSSNMSSWSPVLIVELPVATAHLAYAQQVAGMSPLSNFRITVELIASLYVILLHDVPCLKLRLLLLQVYVRHTSRMRHA